jgi:hypothetical protein
VFPVRYELNLYMLRRRKWTTERRCIVSCAVRTEFICYVEESGLVVRVPGSGFYSRRYQIF